jgi:HAD superfamily hydrolase (TIGR01450 family)
MTTKLESFDELIDSYDAFFFDAFGVLVDGGGLLDGAKELLDKLYELKKPYWIVSNGASKSTQKAISHYRNLGFKLDDGHVITSGSLLKSYFEKESLCGAKVAVLGTESSKDYVSESSCELVNIDDEFDVLVIANQTDYPFIEYVDKAMSRVMKAYDQGKKIRLVLPNPDLFYPKASGEYGFTAGSIALMMESIFKARYGENCDLVFEKLGKPYSPIFERAIELAATKKVLMVGDQILTDIKGAADIGIDSLLLMTGLCSREALEQEKASKPTYVLESLIG